MTAKYLKVYGASDDLVEFEGAFREEFNVYGPAVFLIRITDQVTGSQALFNLSAKFCSVGWRLSLETFTGASTLHVGVVFRQYDGRPEDPLIFFDLREHLTVEVAQL